MRVAGHKLNRTPTACGRIEGSGGNNTFVGGAFAGKDPGTGDLPRSIFERGSIQRVGLNLLG